MHLLEEEVNPAEPHLDRLNGDGVSLNGDGRGGRGREGERGRGGEIFDY